MGCCSSSESASPQSQNINNMGNKNQQEPKQQQQQQPQQQAADVSKSSASTKPSTTTTPTKILVLLYSTYGHCVQMAQAAVDGATQRPNTAVSMKRVPETLPADVVEKLHATEAQLAFHDAIPVAQPDELAEYDGIIFVFPTRFGMAPAQMKSFLDATGGLWFGGKLVGKVGSVITSSATQHGGQESTILNFHTLLLHHGMSIVGLPATWGKQGDLSALNGGSYYGASTITGADGSRMPSEHELDAAKFQGKHVAALTAKLTA